MDILLPAPGRRNERITAVIPQKQKKSIRRSSSTIYSYEEEDDVNPSHTASTPDSPLGPETAALRSQICGLPIETVAMSRTSPLSVLSPFKLVMQDQPSLKMQRNERQWVGIFDRVLLAGEVGQGSGVFRKVCSFLIIAPFICVD